jgi:hypothetical protein
MPKLKCLVIAAGAAILSSSVALADTEDRSYLPPQGLQTQAKEPRVEATPKAGSRLRNTHYGSPRRYARRHYTHWRGRRNYASGGILPGIFFGLFR